MGVEGENVFYSHFGQFLESHGAVQGLPVCAFVLAAFIEIRHDYIDAPGFSAHCRNHPLQILEMVIRGHSVGITADGIGETVIAHVHQNVNIIPPDRFIQHSFGLSGAETGNLGMDDKRIPFIVLKAKTQLLRHIALFSPLDDPAVDFFTQGSAAFQGHDPQPSYR